MELAFKADEPEHGDGDDGGEDGPVCCEWCEESGFVLGRWNGMNMAMCMSCGMPQSNLTWGCYEQAEV